MARRRRRVQRKSRNVANLPRRRNLRLRGLALLTILAFVSLGVFAVSAWMNDTPLPRGGAGYTVVRTLPHDPGAYTQGLLFHEGFLYEGTGQYGESSLRKVELDTGKVLRIERLPRHLFGEGIALWGDRIAQLTWRAGVGQVRDRETFRLLRQFRYDGEGWGLTHDGTHLILSDGSATLRFLDPEDFTVKRTLHVTDRGRPLRNLNELEMVRGELFANVWQTQRIARISLETGRVNGWIDLRGLLAQARRAARPGHKLDVLNGIAYDAKGDRLFVTGKLWPVVFEIRVASEPSGSP
ncbi:MAG: glutaminyl-peptide cyclotransferase [Planctomycetes bacterium]|nr:glutaminyl-peptide cyclotransferase [Planctomycetota bacterium]